jgi:group I intron endonuclease
MDLEKCKRLEVEMPRTKMKNTNLGCIYLITNTINGKKYVGQHNEEKPDSRFSDHKCKARNNRSDCPVLYDAIRCHGEDNFKIETLWVGSITELNEKEVYYADIHKTYVYCDPPGYNVAHCGNQPMLGHHHSEESKAAISERFKNLVRTEEHCARIGAGVSEYIASHPEEMAERNKRISETLIKKGPTGPQSIEAVKNKIEAAAKHSPIPTSSGERHIWKDRNAWHLSIKNNLNTYEARFTTKERAIKARDLFISSGHKTETDFPKKVSDYGKFIRKNRNGKFMVDIHSTRFPKKYAKVFPTLEEAITARDDFLKQFESV